MLGIRFTSKKFPENSVFLPATGAMTSGDPVAPSVGGYYWCRNIQESFGSAESFFFRAQNPQPALSGEPQRTEGLCVRAVRSGN